MSDDLLHMDSDTFNQEAQKYMDMLVAAFATGRCIAYSGYLNGEEVIILGYQEHTNGQLDAKPLAVCMTDAVFNAIEVDGEKVNL